MSKKKHGLRTSKLQKKPGVQGEFEQLRSLPTEELLPSYFTKNRGEEAVDFYLPSKPAGKKQALTGKEASNFHSHNSQELMCHVMQQISQV